MNISEVTITGENLFASLAGDPSENAVLKDISFKIKKNILPHTEMQFGQIMSLLHPYQMARLLVISGYASEADMISRWFLADDATDCSGMLNAIPGAWNVDRIVKHICRHGTVDFKWVDEEKYVSQARDWYGLIETFDDQLVQTYSKPISDQFPNIASRLRTAFI